MDTADMHFEINILKLQIRDQQESINILKKLVKEMLDLKYQDNLKLLEKMNTGEVGL